MRGCTKSLPMAEPILYGRYIIKFIKMVIFRYGIFKMLFRFHGIPKFLEKYMGKIISF